MYVCMYVYMYVNIYIYIFIDKTDPKDPNRREHYWRHILRTMAPDGLNIEDD